jgi:hypothetical protein
VNHQSGYKYEVASHRWSAPRPLQTTSLEFPGRSAPAFSSITFHSFLERPLAYQQHIFACTLALGIRPWDSRAWTIYLSVVCHVLSIEIRIGWSSGIQSLNSTSIFTATLVFPPVPHRHPFTYNQRLWHISVASYERPKVHNALGDGTYVTFCVHEEGKSGTPKDQLASYPRQWGIPKVNPWS